MRSALGTAGFAALVAASLACVPAAGLEFEPPRMFKASALLKPGELEGPHHTVDEQVPTEGLFHEFTIRSDFGTIEAEGLSLLRTRLAEVEALAQLEEVSKTRVFLDAAGRSLESLGRGVVSAVKDPGATVEGLGRGLKRFGVNLGRKTKRAAEDVGDAVTKDEETKEAEESAGEKPAGAERVANAVLGVNRSARIWAQKLRIDPYTTNPVLSKALLEVGRVDAAGGIATRIVVPVPTAIGMTSSVGNLVWGQDPEELRKTNEARLTALGVPADVQKAFFRNDAFTLTYQTRFIAALHAVKAKGLADYVDAARESKTEREALFFVESAEMLQGLHARSAVSRVLTDSRALVASTAGGKGIALLPLDYVRWTESVQETGKEVAQRTKSELGKAALEMHLTGKASPRAKKELEALGWTLGEGVTIPGAREE